MEVVSEGEGGGRQGPGPAEPCRPGCAAWFILRAVEEAGRF